MSRFYLLHGGGFIPATIITQTPKKADVSFQLCGVRHVRSIHKNCLARCDEKVMLFRDKSKQNQLSILRIDSGMYPNEINVDENIGVCDGA